MKSHDSSIKSLYNPSEIHIYWLIVIDIQIDVYYSHGNIPIWKLDISHKISDICEYITSGKLT